MFLLRKLKIRNRGREAIYKIKRTENSEKCNVSYKNILLFMKNILEAIIYYLKALISQGFKIFVYF